MEEEEVKEEIKKTLSLKRQLLNVMLESGKYVALGIIWIVPLVITGGVLPTEQAIAIFVAVCMLIVCTICLYMYAWVRRERKLWRGYTKDIIDKYVPIIDQKTKQLEECYGNVETLKELAEDQQIAIDAQSEVMNSLLEKFDKSVQRHNIAAEMLEHLEEMKNE